MYELSECSKARAQQALLPVVVSTSLYDDKIIRPAGFQIAPKKTYDFRIPRKAANGPVVAYYN